MCHVNRKLRTHLITLLMLKPRGLLLLAPPCGTFSWMCRYSTGRREILPEGLSSEKVVQANLLGSRLLACMCACTRSMHGNMLHPYLRTALLWYVASAMSIYIMLEQPQHGETSLFKMPRFQELATTFTVPLQHKT